MSDEQRPIFVPIGDNPARPFGMDARDRVVRLATNAGFECGEEPQPGRANLLASMAYAWDPAWLGTMAARPGTVLQLQGQAVMAHIAEGGDLSKVADAIRGAGGSLASLEPVDAATTELNYGKLRKRERPFVLPLDPGNPDLVERAAYDAAYKGVTDALTLYLWRKPAFYLTRWAARGGLTPNTVTGVGAILCVLAFWLFWNGDYWLGVAAGFIFMVLDTVDGKLARCTGTSSYWGNIFDHGIDLVHPLFWWWAWQHGLEAYGRPIEPVYATMLLTALAAGYVLQRLIEGYFVRRWKKMHIHVWQRIDSRFRLITARRNPNMVILVAALLFGRPDVGLELMTLWTIICLIFHAVRLAQAKSQAERGIPIRSWLET